MTLGDVLRDKQNRLNPPQQPRPLYVIAKEIRDDWSKQKGGINYAAKPYLDAMTSLNSIKDNYMLDDGVSIVLYFLSNAGQWRGETARRIKAELNKMVKAR
jgi:hypothetical protein